MRRLIAINGMVVMLLFVGALQASRPDTKSEGKHSSKVLLFGESFDLGNPVGIGNLEAFIARRLRSTKLSGDEWDQDKKALLLNRELGELSPAELKIYFHTPPGVLSKKVRRGLVAISDRAVLLLYISEAEKIDRLQAEIRELCVAVMNNFRSPIPNVGFASTWMALDNLSNTVGNGDVEAGNIGECSGDVGSCFPPNSTFWALPESISQRNLYAGFDRLSIPDWGGRIWNYDKPKTSRGGNPGFEVRYGGAKAKVKFAETFSEPFTTRIFHALGYNVDVCDHVGAIKVSYDRRIFREFNLRQKLSLNVRPLGLFTVASINMQAHHDPFDFVAAAVLKNGDQVKSSEFRKRLLIDETKEHAELLAENYDEDFEREIDYVIADKANFQIDNDDVKSVGPWGFAQLGHEHLREVRAVGLLAAWLGWFDTRFDNTRLRLDDGELRHYFSDLGGGLGKTDAAFNWKPESPNDFPWEFTAAPIVRGKGRMTTPFRVINFHTILDNEAFKAMTAADAVWMARLIGQLSREQIVDALSASGYGEAETVLYTEKLVCRRNKMIRDLGLEKEFPDLPQQFESRDFDFDPINGPTRIVSGKVVQKRTGMSVSIQE